jgi:hypothetical protein
MTSNQAPFELVHSDINGPFPIPFLGAQYTLTLSHDHTWHTWVYLLKLKSEVYNILLPSKH